MGCAGNQIYRLLTISSEDFIPIPGTKRVKYLEENAEATKVALSRDEEAHVRKIVDSVGGAKGDRYPVAMMAALFGNTPELK